jgi:hypothetical protein
LYDLSKLEPLCRCYSLNRLALDGGGDEAVPIPPVDVRDPDVSQEGHIFPSFQVAGGRTEDTAKGTTGIFGARMKVELVNDGPVTMVLEI